MRSCQNCSTPLPVGTHGSRKYCDQCVGNIARERGRSKTGSCSRCGRPVHKTRPKGAWTPPEAHICRPCRAILAEAEGRSKARRSTPFQPELRSCKRCNEMFEARVHNQLYCKAECREANHGWSNNPTQRVASADERGYGKEHRAARARWRKLIDEAGGINCCLCGKWIDASETWHLDHTPERDGYRGAAHARCNVRDGASRGARRSNIGRSYTKACAACSTEFSTPYPKQAYCSRACRPKPQWKPAKTAVPKQCVDCGQPIKRGKRCKPCAEAEQRNYMRDYARNAYRARVGIPLDAPKYDRSWRAA